jgi:predicted RND superfamily exporter protein
MREKLFNILTRWSVHHPWKTLGIAFLLFLIMGGLSSRIHMDATWMGMVPKNETVVTEFNRITDNFSGAINQIILGIEGNSPENCKAAAHKVEEALQPLVNGQDLKRITWQMPVEFIKDHGFMLTEEKDLKRLVPMTRDFNLVRNERAAVASLEGIDKLVVSLDKAVRDSMVDNLNVVKSIDRFWIGDDAMISQDGSMLLMVLQPMVSINDINRAVKTVNRVDSALALVKPELKEKVRIGGIYVVARDEMKTGTEDSFLATILAFVAIIIMLIFAFRMKLAPILAMVPLVVGITWDMGLGAVFIGRLNIITAFVAVYMVGLGVDFAIHFLQGFVEQRRAGVELETAVSRVFDKSGNGILTGGLTTAIAFLALMFTDYDIFKEMGFMAGLGVVCCVAATFLTLPSLLVIKDRRAERRGKYTPPPEQIGQSKLISKWTHAIARYPKSVLVACLLLLGCASYYGVTGTWFDPNFMHEEAKGLESIELQEDIVEVFQMAQDNAVFTVPDLDSAHRITVALQDRRPVAMVESPSQFCPPEAVQAQRIPYLEQIQQNVRITQPLVPVDVSALKSELERLEANVIEMSQSAYQSLLDRVVRRADRMTGLDSLGKKAAPGIFTPLLDVLDRSSADDIQQRLAIYQKIFKNYSTELTARMAGTDAINWDMTPQEYTDRMRSDDGSEFLVTVYPRNNIWEELDDSPFLKLLLKKVPQVTGMTSFMEVMYRRGKEEGIKAIIYAFIAILILLSLDFRSIKYVILAVVPLLAAVVFLVGGYGLTGAPFGMMNIMAIPLILGIGIDDGVHVCHRYRKEGEKDIPDVFGRVGRAVLLTSLTTMLAFGSLCFGKMQGNVHLGAALFFGVGLCFLTTVTVLPAILAIILKNPKS